MDADAPLSIDPATRLLVLSPGQQLSMKLCFEYAARVSASDLLITAGSPPVVRVIGDLMAMTDVPLRPEDSRRLVFSLLNETQQEMFERKKELDFSLAVTGNLRFRANIYYQKGAVSAAFRLIPTAIPAIEQLGLPPEIKALTMKNNGLLLVTGPTGSGKSTTLAALIDVINAHKRCHIVTVEDPIEYLHLSKRAVIDQREVYADTLSFANALKYVLRQDPDVILVGEMRDLETISAALTAAETGHLVLATLHTNDAVQSIDRIVDVFPPHQHDQVRTQLAFCLLGVLSQQLIPRADGKGRVMCYEFMVKNHAVAAHIREGKTHQTRSVLETSKDEGMISMDKKLKELYEAELIAWEEVERRVSHPAFLKIINRRLDFAAFAPLAEEQR